MYIIIIIIIIIIIVNAVFFRVCACAYESGRGAHEISAIIIYIAHTNIGIYRYRKEEE